MTWTVNSSLRTRLDTHPWYSNWLLGMMGETVPGGEEKVFVTEVGKKEGEKVGRRELVRE